jgi:hypothetical protein
VLEHDDPRAINTSAVPYEVGRTPEATLPRETVFSPPAEAPLELHPPRRVSWLLVVTWSQRVSKRQAVRKLHARDREPRCCCQWHERREQAGSWHNACATPNTVQVHGEVNGG